VQLLGGEICVYWTVAQKMYIIILSYFFWYFITFPQNQRYLKSSLVYCSMFVVKSYRNADISPSVYVWMHVTVHKLLNIFSWKLIFQEFYQNLSLHAVHLVKIENSYEYFT